MGRIFSKIVIVGLGLLGSSVGLSARRADLADEIVGLDQSRTHADEALRLGAVDRIAENDSDALAPSAVAADSANSDAPANPAVAAVAADFNADSDISLDADPDAQTDIVRPILIVIAVPVGGVAEELDKAIAAVRRQNRNGAGRFFILTDTASVQSGIRESLRETLPENAVFIGSHPIAGSEKSGPAAGTADLFSGKRIVITPTAAENPRGADPLSILERFWARLGAETVRLPAGDHDRILAKTSHLPHLISILLSEIPSDDETPFIGTGWAGMTRLAGSSPAVWSDIFVMNRRLVLNAVHEMETVLSKWKAVLEEGDRDQIFTLLEEAKKRRDALGN